MEKEKPLWPLSPASTRPEVHPGDHVTWMGWDAEVKAVDGNEVTLEILNRGVEVTVIQQPTGEFALRLL